MSRPPAADVSSRLCLTVTSRRVLKAEAPWSPTGVALHEGSIFALEYTVINDETHNYLPRVRKLGHDGRVTTLTTFAK